MQVPTAAELNAVATVKSSQIVRPNDIKENPSIDTPIAPARALGDNNVIRLSKRQKMEMMHQGMREVSQTWKTQPTYELVMGTWQYVAPEARPDLSLGVDDDRVVMTDPGTFTKVSGFKTKDWQGNDIEPFESYYYDGNPSSSSANDGLILPSDFAMAAELAQDRGIILDAPGRTDGTPMTEEDYLTMPGRAGVTSATFVAALAKINAMRAAVGGSSAGLVAQDLINAGISENSIRWTARTYYTSKITQYKAYILAAANPYTATSLMQMVTTVNAL
jgi:hypothetical protein